MSDQKPSERSAPLSEEQIDALAVEFGLEFQGYAQWMVDWDKFAFEVDRLRYQRDVFNAIQQRAFDAEAALARVKAWADEQDYTKTPGNPESYSQWAEATDAAREVALRLIEGAGR